MIRWQRLPACQRFLAWVFWNCILSQMLQFSAENREGSTTVSQQWARPSPNHFKEDGNFAKSVPMQGLECRTLLPFPAPCLPLWGCVQLFLGPSKRVVGVKHESFGFIEAKAFASCRRNRRVVAHFAIGALCWPKLCPAQVPDGFLSFPPNTSAKFEEFQGHVATKTQLTDLCCHPQRKRRMGWFSNESCRMAWNFIYADFHGETTET